MDTDSLYLALTEEYLDEYLLPSKWSDLTVKQAKQVLSR